MGDIVTAWYQTTFIIDKVSKWLGYGKKGGICRKAGGLSGGMALAMAAYETQAFKEKKKNSKELRKIYKKGYMMHLVHSVALTYSDTCNKPVTGGLFTLGIILYSGSCYAQGLTGESRFEYGTTVGVIVLISAWLSMIYGEK